MRTHDVAATARLASRTSRRSVLARVGQGLIAAALITVASPKPAAASSCSCQNNRKCNPALDCGSTGDSANACCSNYPPCVACGAGGISSGTSCTGPGYVAGWYWYCCVGAGNLNELWKCQDCCSPFDACYTLRSLVGTC